MTAPEGLIGGRYRLVRKLGAGGMGTVWEAWDELLHRPVAVKQLLSQPGLSPAAAEMASNRAMREARITARLHHPHAVPVYDVVEQDGRPCLIMQYLPSVSLDALVKAKGVMPPADVARIGAELAAALAAAHEVGIVHRDVKPGNVLITRDGSAKVTDFGIAHAWGDVTLTSTGILTGTPAYLAPEVARGEESGFPADVFSLGSTLYAALEGVAPFGTDANPMAVLYKVAAGQVTPPRRSEALSPLLMRMLAPEPADRPSMAEVTRALTLLQPRLASEPDTTQPVASQPPVDEAPIGATAVYSDLQPVPEPTPQPSQRPTTQFAVQPPAQSEPRLPGRDSAAVPTAEHQPAEGDRRSGSMSRSASRRPALVIAAAVLILAAATLFGYLAIREDPKDEQAGSPTTAVATGAVSTSSGPTSASSSAPTSSQVTSASSSAPSSSSASASTSASSSSSAPASGGAPSAAALAGAVTSYYALLPGNTDQGFAQLTNRYKSTNGQTLQRYKGFWSQFQGVKVSGAVAAPPSTVTATITYTYKNGGTAVEKRSFTLVSENGVLKIDASSVISG